MKTILKLVTVTATGVAALALAGNALAVQKLSLAQTGTSVTVKASQANSDQQPAKLQIYVPSGYTLGTIPAAGTKVGTTTGVVFARDQGIPLPLSGDVLVDDPAKHTKDACSPGSNVAVLILQLSVAGQTIALPLYINPTSAAEAGLGAIKLVVCLAPSDTPAGSPGRSPFGAQLLNASFTVDNLFTPPAGATRWESLWTPYSAGTGIPNPAGTVEARAFVGPGAITLSGRVTSKAKRTVALTGKVTASGVDVVGASVSLLLNGKVRYKAKTNAGGAYKFTLQKKKNSPVTTTFFQSKVTVAEQDVTSTGCGSPALAPIPCVSATQGAFTAISNKIKIHI
jgi:hypothetical protein